MAPLLIHRQRSTLFLAALAILLAQVITLSTFSSHALAFAHAAPLASNPNTKAAIGSQQQHQQQQPHPSQKLRRVKSKVARNPFLIQNMEWSGHDGSHQDLAHALGAATRRGSTRRRGRPSTGTLKKIPKDQQKSQPHSLQPVKRNSKMVNRF